jgi:hypothetical protein
MVRAVALLSLAIGFLSISPKLRLTAYDGITVVVNHLEQYSPYSYVVVVICLLIGFLFLMKGSTAPKSR